GFQPTDDHANFAIKDIPDVIQALFIIFLSLVSFTGSFAVSDLVLEANLKLPFTDVFFTECQVTRPQRVQFANGIHDGMHHADGGVGPEVSRPVPDELPCWKNPRKALVFDDNPGIRLVILEHDIISGLVLFDQAIFQEPGIDFRINNGECDPVDLTHQYTGFAVQLTIFNKVRSHPVS